VGRLEALAVCTGLLCMAAAGTVDAAARGAYFAPGGSAPRAPEIMLYFSHSVGGGATSGSMRPTFGLRVQQVHQAANTGDPEQGESMQHRELINWQFDSRSNLRLSQSRVKLGNKLTYDFASSRFGSPSRSVIQVGTPSLRTAAVSAASPVSARPFATPNSVSGFADIRPAGVGRADSSRDNSNMHDIAAAAIAALAPTLSAAQRQSAARQGAGLTVVAAAQRSQATTALR
jgi:hypothetical protein